jgi:excisionase family DNA binding protein
MNMEETADYLRVSVRLIQKLVYSRKLRPARVGRRLLFQRAEIDHFVSILTASAD